MNTVQTFNVHIRTNLYISHFGVSVEFNTFLPTRLASLLEMVKECDRDSIGNSLQILSALGFNWDLSWSPGDSLSCYMFVPVPFLSIALDKGIFIQYILNSLLNFSVL